MKRDAKFFIEKYEMVPLPEGGYFAPVSRGEFIIPHHLLGDYSGEREAVSLIYYLLEAGDESKWHMLRPEEYWLWHAGGTLQIVISETDSFKRLENFILDPESGDFIVKIPAGYWQTAKVLDGDFVLVSCVVSPGYHDDELFFLDGGIDG